MLKNNEEYNFKKDKDLSKIEMASEGATGCGLGCLGVVILLINIPLFLNII